MSGDPFAVDRQCDPVAALQELLNRRRGLERQLLVVTQTLRKLSENVAALHLDGRPVLGCSKCGNPAATSRRGKLLSRCRMCLDKAKTPKAAKP